MHIVQDELWKPPGHPGVIVVTTNSFVRRDERLVMGRGAAYEATQKIPGIDREAGRKILEVGDDYGFLMIRMPEPPRVGFGIFQVKSHWNQPAELELIQLAVEAMAEYCHINPTWNFRMNFPGIGNGGLNPHEVRPLLENLPDNVTIVHKGEYSEPVVAPGLDMRTVLAQIVSCIEKGQRQLAVDYVQKIGFPDPEGQVNAVQDMLIEWRQNDPKEVKRRRRKLEQAS